MLKFRDRALKVIAELEMEKDDFSLREFEHNFRLAFNPVRRNVFDFWDEIVEELKLAGRMGNARFHNDTSKSVLRYLKFDKDLSYINKWVDNLNSFEYPSPIVEHKWARNRALEAYKTGLAKN